MPMSASSMAQKIVNNLGISAEPHIMENWTAICTGIIAEITTNAQVGTGIPVSTSGSPSAQTGATTAPGTIS